MVWKEDDEVGIPGALPPHNDAGMLGNLLLMSVTWLICLAVWGGAQRAQQNNQGLRRLELHIYVCMCILYMNKYEKTELKLRK